MICLVGLITVPATTALWHVTATWLQPPEERRWANRTIQRVAGPHLEAVRQYASSALPPAPARAGAMPATAWDEPNVAVYSTPDTKPAPAPVTLDRLSDLGQAHAIDTLAKTPGDADKTWSKLSKALTGPDGGVERRDPYRADRVLVATVARGMLAMPGDRLLWSRVFVQPINFEFAGYTIASTELRTIRIAGVESTQEDKLSLGFGLDAALSGASKDSPAPSVTAATKATAEIDQQYEGLGVDIRPEFLRIMRESAVGGDVVGNTAIHLSVLTDPQSIRRGTTATVRDDDIPSLVVDQAHLTDGVSYLPADKAEVIVHPQDVLPHCPLIANVWMIYEMRKVSDGGSHYLEGLQTVSLVQDGTIRQTVEIVPADDIAPAVWSIKRKNGATDLGAAADLRANTPDGASRRVVSTDYVTLSELTHWIKAHPVGTKLHELQFDNAAGETLVPFKNVQNDCEKPGDAPVGTSSDR